MKKRKQVKQKRGENIRLSVCVCWCMCVCKLECVLVQVQMHHVSALNDPRKVLQGFIHNQYVGGNSL